MAAKLKKDVLLSETDVFCYICRSILIEPVTVPCKHVFCKSCFENSLQETSYSCPLCRRRISNWLRSAKKADKLLNSDLWEQIKIQYKDEVNSKLSGKDDGLDERIQHKFERKMILTPSGVIGQEYSKFVKDYEEQLRLQREREEAESLALIRRLQDEERQNIEKQESLSLQAALKLQKEERGKNQSSLVTSKSSCTTSNKPSATTSDKKHVIGPMDFHIKRLSLSEAASKKSSKAGVGRRVSSDSNDSITPEIMQHFKPIRGMPKTPPKRSHDGKIVEVMPQKVTPLKNFMDNRDLIRFTVSDSYRSIQSSFSAFRGKSACIVGAETSEEKMELIDNVMESGVLKEINLDENSDSNSLGLAKTEADVKNMDETIAVKIPKLGVPLTDTENLEELYDSEEQRRLEQRLLQEKADHELALKLSREWGKSYELRRARVPYTNRSAPRQTTLVNAVVRRRAK